MHPNMYDLNSVIIITFHGLINNQIIEVSGCFFLSGREKGPSAFQPTVRVFRRAGIVSKSVDLLLNFSGNFFRDDLLFHDEVEDLTAGLVAEEFDRVLHQVRSEILDDGGFPFVRKKVLHFGASEIHDNPPFRPLFVLHKTIIAYSPHAFENDL